MASPYASGGKILLLYLFVSLGESFCPNGCHCNDSTLKTICVSANLEIIPILLNPGTSELDLSYNKIAKIDTGFDFYANLTTLNLSNNKIKSLGSKYFAFLENLYLLNINNNNVTEIGARAFAGLHRLSELDISQNYISKISKGSFSSLSKLNVLDMSFNEIESLEKDVFVNLHNLVILNLCNNKLQNISETMFQHLKNLIELRICFNKLSVIGDSAFIQQSKLYHLYLDNNKLYNISGEALRGTSSLKLLNLDKNLLSEVPYKEAKSHSSLEYLILSNNNFEIIISNAFSNLSRLKNLSLSDNDQLRLIEPSAFVGLGNLHMLDLSNNRKLKNIPSGSFDQLKKLRHLLLRRNSFRTLDESLIHPSRLYTLDLRNNPLECNCSLNWLGKLLRQRNSSLRIEDVKCKFPEKLENKSLRFLTEYELKCYNNILFIVSTTSACVVLLLFFLISSYIYFVRCKKMKSIVQDTWPEKIVTTWNGTSGLDKQLQDDDYTFQAPRGSFKKSPFLWQEPDKKIESYSQEFTASSPHSDYKDYRDPVFNSKTAHKLRNKMYASKYRTMTRTFTEPCHNSFNDMGIESSFSDNQDRLRDSTASSIVTKSSYDEPIFNSVDKAPTWRSFEDPSRITDLSSFYTMQKEAPIQSTLDRRPNGERVFTLSHLYALPKHPNFGYNEDSIYDNII